MAHQVGDIVEVSFRGTCENQMVLNVWHVIVTSSVSQSSDVGDNQSLASWYRGQIAEGQVTKDFLNLMPTNYVLNWVRAQKIDPNRSTYGQSSAELAGFLGVLSNNTNTAAVITKQGSSGTRRATGAIHIGPVAETQHLRGKLTDTYIQMLDTFRNSWKAPFTVPGINIGYALIIYNRGAVPNYQQIVGSQIQDTLRVMRRRTVGQGV